MQAGWHQLRSVRYCSDVGWQCVAVSVCSRSSALPRATAAYIWCCTIPTGDDISWFIRYRLPTAACRPLTLLLAASFAACLCICMCMWLCSVARSGRGRAVGPDGERDAEPVSLLPAFFFLSSQCSRSMAWMEYADIERCGKILAAGARVPVSKGDDDVGVVVQWWRTSGGLETSAYSTPLHYKQMHAAGHVWAMLSSYSDALYCVVLQHCFTCS